jgi:hypothetical protein
MFLILAMALKKPRSKRGKPAALQTTTIPAPIRGMDGRVSLAEMPAENCIFAYNIMPSEYGARTRKGSIYHQDTVGGDAVRTIVPFKGQDPANDKLFAMSTAGIYDVTVAAATPVQDLAWATASGNAGHGVFVQFTNTAGAHFILYADEVNGLHTYTESTDSWAISTAITGTTIGDIRFVGQHQNRIWVVEENSDSAFYLGIGAISGGSTEFFFGHKFVHGGHIAGIWTWSVDGGEGADDVLVCASTSGDVVVFEGTDPASASTWGARGQYYIGRLPAGRRQAAEINGNLYLLCSDGLIGMADLLRGGDNVDTSPDSLAYKVSRFVRAYFRLNPDELGWEVVYLPEDGMLVVNMPLTTTETHQFVLNIATGGWGIWRDRNYYTIAEWNGESYFGREDDVLRITGARDNVADDGTGGDDVLFSILSSYGSLGQPGLQKTVQLVRPQWSSAIEPSYTTQVRYDFDTDEVVGTYAVAPTDTAVWDTATWDTEEWAGDAEGQASVRGAMGMGRFVAIAMNGISTEPSTLVGWDIMWTNGGFL